MAFRISNLPFFPGSDDSNNDYSLSRRDSTKQYFAENMIPNVCFPADYITSQPSTPKIKTINKIPDNQNSKTGITSRLNLRIN